jgi:hypothetical protein
LVGFRLGRPHTGRRSLRAGTYYATVLVRTNDPGAPEIRVSVAVTVRKR